MSQDPYQCLGLPAGAGAAEIKAAWRDILRNSHPDLHPGDAAAEARFRAAKEAYDLLSDPVSRAAHDRAQQERAARKQAAPHAPSGAPAGEDDADFFASMSAGRGSFDLGEPPQEPAVPLRLDMVQAVQGGLVPLDLPDGGHLRIRVPPGARDGQILRLRGRGRGGADLRLCLRVIEHPLFAPEGNNLRLDLPVTADEAARAARVDVPTPGGPVRLGLPSDAADGRKLRLRGRGLTGDLIVTLRLRSAPQVRDWRALYLGEG